MINVENDRMKITSRIDSNLPKTIADRVEHYANTRLNRFASAIREVHATVTDLNGPRGGVDMRCQLYVTLRKGGVEVLVQETAESVGEALSKAFDRAARTVGRRLERLRLGRRQLGGHRVASALLASDP